MSREERGPSPAVPGDEEVGGICADHDQLGAGPGSAVHRTHLFHHCEASGASPAPPRGHHEHKWLVQFSRHSCSM